MNKVDKNPDDYIASLPKESQADMKKLDREIQKIMKNTRVLWGGVFWGGSEQNIIGYGDMVFKGKTRSVEWFVVGLALQKNYISVYINGVEDDIYLVEKYKNELGKVKAGKSVLSFKSLEDVNLEKLFELIKKARKLATLI